ncbi:transcriptional protein SWT1 [Eurosta solidaginis]|uniref:transcriptional protein SWT1 n=1 Tax=Eurosta solidaginis TaxID=178769 RepID=UPI0035314978
MEKLQLRGSTAKSDDWIKYQSKKRPNQFYMFNKATGETKWCGEMKNDRLMSTNELDRKPPPLPPICTSAKSTRTPAQDRLKRLQSNLKKEHKDKVLQKQINVPRYRSQDKEAITKREIENANPKVPDMQKNKKSNIQLAPNTTSKHMDKDAIPSTSKSSLRIKTEMEAKMPENTTQKGGVSKKSYNNSPRKEPKKRAACNSTNDTTLKPQKRPKQDFPLQEKDLSNTDEAKKESNTNQSTSTTLGIGSGFVNKIKDICKRTLNSYRNAKKALSQRPLEPCIKKTNFKIPKKDYISQHSTTQLAPQRKEKLEKESNTEDRAAINSMTRTAPMAIVMTTATPNHGQATVDFKEIALTASPSHIFGTPNNFFVPAYERGSANTRLERLRQSLHQQAVSTNEEIITSTRLCASATSSALACVIRDSNVFDNNLKNEDDEPMDWMPTDDIKTETIELSSNESSSAAPSVRSEEVESMGEYYGTVNKNLLRCAVEQRLDSSTATEKWLNDCYYFVLDTNVLLRHLTFIEDLSHMKLCDTNGTVLYLPYSVLQELDKLKQFAVGDGTKVLAVRAIKYLNSKFESKNKHLQAQSAVSELEHLVEVTSPDDRIINCCLQVKHHVEHVILLTEDINLRTKAICNSILVSTKSDLLANNT